MLQWILDRAVRRGSSDGYVVERLLGSNFAAINSAANVLTNALYHLATLPDATKTLREEIESQIAGEGWTAGAMSKMARLDSFLKETQRYTGVALGKESTGSSRPHRSFSLPFPVTFNMQRL